MGGNIAAAILRPGYPIDMFDSQHEGGFLLTQGTSTSRSISQVFLESSYEIEEERVVNTGHFPSLWWMTFSVHNLEAFQTKWPSSLTYPSVHPSIHPTLMLKTPVPTRRWLTRQIVKTCFAMVWDYQSNFISTRGLLLPSWAVSS